MSCTYHIQNPITAICIASHKCQCQRKLCIECAYNHEVDFKQIVPIKLFQEMVVKKQKESETYEALDLTKQGMNLKSVISQTEITMKKIWEDLQVSIKQIYDLIELQEKTYMEIINNSTNPVELSNTDLETLVQILVGGKLNFWNLQKNFNLRKVEKVKNLLGQEIWALNEKIKKEMILSLEFVIEKQAFIESIKPKLLKDDFWIRLFFILQEKSKKTIKESQLIYNGSRDGLNANSFWNKCDEKSNLLMIFKSQSEYTFGGYSPCKWENKCAIQDDTLSSFLFSQTHDKIYPLQQDKKQYAIWGCNSYGPIFGYNYDICINHDFTGSSTLGTVYQCDKYVNNQTSYLFGQGQPKIVECEIFELKFI
ncbi:unnamed protein product [Paramecium sonneborni]|uniref:TLDc domain-containing protein n=1 Tax=Paramecium sonneborni TaxID=65129 RepID=A0A8S1RTF9_9CILI|nr:unnamed protein product [Paramecium sonneborni]